MESYFRYWGKADPDYPGEPKWHPLVYHSLDVAAVGRELLLRRPAVLEQIARISHIKEEKLLSWLTFLLAIHDIGKFSDSFQNQRPDLLQKLHGRTTSAIYDEHHTVAGYRFCLEEFAQFSGEKSGLEAADLRDLLTPWFSAVTGHHGRPPQENLVVSLLKRQFPSPVRQDTIKFVSDLQNLLLPEGIPFRADDYGHYQYFTRASWLIAGLAVLADWLGSNQKWFGYCDTKTPVKIYWEEALDRATIAVEESGLHTVKPAPLSDIHTLFPKIKESTPLQKLITIIPIPYGPQLFLMEEVTGGGKTEAAVTLAHRLMVQDLAEGIYIALPTMATANAMHQRIKEIYRRLFDNNADPSMVLAHSAARMVLDMEKNNHPDSGCGREGQSASLECAAWLSDSRKKALLADVGVGTIDQALLSILSARHQSLRLLGLARKILIVDEVHACDTYVFRLLLTLLRFHASFGGSAILLSATLPQSMRMQLTRAFAEGEDLEQIKPTKMDYPMLTHLSCEGIREIPVEACTDVSRLVAIQSLQDSSEVAARLVAAVDAGKCACWVRNTVYDVMESYNEWVRRLGRERVMLFHSRYALWDRLKIEQEILSYFGWDSTAAERKGRLLIATQVAEQSLDIDFDYMITDLAPIDLIIQRTGRLMRHKRDTRGNPIEGMDMRGKIVLGVFMPEAVDNADAEWYKEMFPKAASVYTHHGQLWLTAHWLQEHGGFSMPKDARDMIEYVYGEDGRQLLSKALLEIEDRAEGDDKGNASMGSLNSLNLDDGYKATMYHWQDDTNAPTRLGEATVTIRLARLVDGKLEPWVTRTGHDWELSQLSVRLYQIKAEALGFEAEIAAAKQSMPDEGRYCIVIPLALDGDRWIGDAVNGQGKTARVEYSPLVGLQIKGEEI